MRNCEAIDFRKSLSPKLVKIRFSANFHCISVPLRNPNSEQVKSIRKKTMNIQFVTYDIDSFIKVVYILMAHSQHNENGAHKE